MRRDACAIFEMAVLSTILILVPIAQFSSNSPFKGAPMKLRAFFTDIGGCICPDFLEDASTVLAEHFDLSADHVAWAKRDLWQDYACSFGARKLPAGSMLHTRIERQAWAEYADKAEIDATPEEIIEITRQCARPLDPGYEDLFARLDSQGIILGVISNNTSFFWYRQQDALGLERYFTQERVILSCDHGQSKKSPGLNGT